MDTLDSPRSIVAQCTAFEVDFCVVVVISHLPTTLSIEFSPFSFPVHVL